ncbi:MAG: hypothetical protein Q8M37_02065 [Nevskia sp.]|nr:hypothetical protein [Nevskia sp.]
MLDFGDLVVGGLDARHLVEHFLDALGITAGGDERHAVFAQVFGHQAAGVAGDAVITTGFLVLMRVLLG